MTKQQRAVVDKVRRYVEEFGGDGYSITDLKALKTLQVRLEQPSVTNEAAFVGAAQDIVREQELAR